jgi:hypothetical protein
VIAVVVDICGAPQLAVGVVVGGAIAVRRAVVLERKDAWLPDILPAFGTDVLILQYFHQKIMEKISDNLN